MDTLVEPILERLCVRLEGRVAKPRRKLCGKTIVRRDPRDVSFRYLRRFAGGRWYLGGSHVARYNGGNGIGFLSWVNDRAVKILPVLIDGRKGDA